MKGECRQGDQHLSTSGDCRQSTEDFMKAQIGITGFLKVCFRHSAIKYDSMSVCLGFSSVAAGECGGNRGGCQFACRLYAGRIARGDRMGTRVILKVPSSYVPTLQRL